jgi:acetolactate decarboxylase
LRPNCLLSTSLLLLTLLLTSSEAQTANEVAHFPPAPFASDADLFQISTLEALTIGVFDGAYPVGMLRKHGTFGLGTYDGIDGEMIVLDGHFYHARSDGSVEESKDSELTSFAAIVNFVPERKYSVCNMTMSELNTYIASLIPSSNYFYAIKIHGLFHSVTARAIPKLSKPFPTLAEATQEEVVFTRQGVEGTAVVIRSPAYVSNLNVAGDHYHFISDDAKFGGHALDLTAEKVTLEVQEIRRNTLWLPTSDAFKMASQPAPNN